MQMLSINLNMRYSVQICLKSVMNFVKIKKADT